MGFNIFYEQIVMALMIDSFIVSLLYKAAVFNCFSFQTRHIMIQTLICFSKKKGKNYQEGEY